MTDLKLGLYYRNNVPNQKDLIYMVVVNENVEKLADCDFILKIFHKNLAFQTGRVRDIEGSHLSFAQLNAFLMEQDLLLAVDLVSDWIKEHLSTIQTYKNLISEIDAVEKPRYVETCIRGMIECGDEIQKLKALYGLNDYGEMTILGGK